MPETLFNNLRDEELRALQTFDEDFFDGDTNQDYHGDWDDFALVWNS